VASDVDITLGAALPDVDHHVAACGEPALTRPFLVSEQE
jgi:hypothetical protein